MVLKRYYDSSTALISNNNEVSETFRVNSGVKQGGILSPFLFNIYINELIEKCIYMNIGGCIKDINTSIISFCDDINIISSSIKDAKLLLKECEEVFLLIL